MPDSSRAHDVTELLLSWGQGDTAAFDRLVQLVYDDLRRVVLGHLRREPPGHSLQATALVHEVFLRLVDVDRMTLGSRAQFFALSGRLMRRILVDYARRERASERGRGAVAIGLSEAAGAAAPTSPSGVEVLALDEALDTLSSVDVRQGRILELRFFAGLDIPETANALGISTATVEREWAMATAWLHQRLSIPQEPSAG